MSKKLEERSVIVNGDMEDIKMTQTELLKKKTLCDERYIGLD